MNVLFICTGNTCRSPMAEAIMKSKWPEAQVRSAGVFAGMGDPIASHSEQVLEEKDIHIDHETSPVTDELLEWADLVLTMTDRHKQALAIQYAAHQDKYFTLKEYVLLDDGNWQELKQTYSAFEEKKSRIIREHASGLSEEELEQKVMEELQDEISRIYELESSLPDLDISDPFGGNVSIYRETRDELDTYISLLVDKLSNRRS